MGKFRTQFEMNNVLTHVTVEEVEKNTFGCNISSADFPEDAELPVTLPHHDILIKCFGPGNWQTVGEPKVKLDEEDIQSLGNAIEGDKTVELYNSETY
jgi:hypothetical protein